MDIVLKLLNSIPCVKKVETNEEKINCIDNRLYNLEQRLTGVYNNNIVDSKIENINLKIKNIENNYNLKFKNIQENNEVKLKNIEDKQNDLKDVQSEIFYKIQKNAEKLSTITGYLEQNSVSNAFNRSSSIDKRRKWR
jgi:hypothetical protein